MSERGEPPLDLRAGEETEQVVGERGAFSAERGRSLQSRVTTLLAAGLMTSLGVGLIGWYYLHTFHVQSQAKRAAQSAPRSKAEGDMPLPPLGRITPPAPVTNSLLGPPPDPPPPDPADGASTHEESKESKPVTNGGQVMTRAATRQPFKRLLAGPAFSREPETVIHSAASAGSIPDSSPPSAALPGSGLLPPSVAASSPGDLASLLKPSITPAVRASVLPTQRLLLPKGAFIDCTLETAIDSTLPGMTTCVTATDTFSADGSTVLMEMGTKLVGETRGEVSQGASRVFVLWTEARTPAGVVVPLASPGTDELGRSGLSGEVNRHFWARFGSAILVSVIDGAVQGAVQGAASHGGGTVIFNPSGSTQVMTEVLKGTLNIAPTVTKHNGDRIEILVARDLDFRPVYELVAVKPPS